MYQNGMNLPSTRANALAAGKVNIIGKPIKSRMDEQGDRQFISDHQAGCDDRNHIEDFHHGDLNHLELRRVRFSSFQKGRNVQPIANIARIAPAV